MYIKYNIIKIDKQLEIYKNIFLNKVFKPNKINEKQCQKDVNSLYTNLLKRKPVKAIIFSSPIECFYACIIYKLINNKEKYEITDEINNEIHNEIYTLIYENILYEVFTDTFGKYHDELNQRIFVIKHNLDSEIEKRVSSIMYHILNIKLQQGISDKLIKEIINKINNNTNNIINNEIKENIEIYIHNKFNNKIERFIYPYLIKTSRISFLLGLCFDNEVLNIKFKKQKEFNLCKKLLLNYNFIFPLQDICFISENYS